MSEAENPKNSGLIERLDRTAKTYSNAKTLVVAVASAFGVIFAAGIYYNELRHSLNDYIGRIESLEADRALLKNQIEALSKDQSDEKKNIRTAINKAFAQLVQIKNAERPPFRNTEPDNNGGGNSPTTPPGRCQVGEMVVGVGPFKETSGKRSIDMQCGVMPLVKLD